MLFGSTGDRDMGEAPINARSNRVFAIVAGGAIVALLFFSALIVASSGPRQSGDCDIGPIYATAFLPDGKQFVTANHDGTVRRWNAQSGEEVESYGQQRSAVTAVAVSPNGQHIAATWNDWENGRFGVMIWEAIGAKEVCQLIGHSHWVNDVTFTPDGKFLVSAGADKTIRKWCFETRREVLCLRGHAADVNAVCVSPDGQTLLSAAGDYWGGKLNDPTVRIWSLSDGSQIGVFDEHRGAVYDVATTPDGAIVASASWNDTIRIWDRKTGKLIRTLKGADVHAVAIDPAGRRVLSGSGVGKGAVQLWDLESGEQLRTFPCKTEAHDVCFSPDGKLGISAHGYHAGRRTKDRHLGKMETYVKDGVAIVWDIEDGKGIVRVGDPRSKE